MNTSLLRISIAASVGLIGLAAQAHASTHAGIRSLGRGPNSNAACALLADRHVVCWGSLFCDSSTDRSPQLVPNLSNVEYVAVGDGFGCGLLSDKSVSCWGSNTDGQLGDGPTPSRTQAGPVGGRASYLPNIVSIAAGAFHMCAANEAGNAYCWGYNGSSQLGNFNVTADSFNVPIIVVIHDFFMNPALSGVTSVSAGFYFSCAMQGSTALCWGSNVDGQIGNGSATSTIDGPARVLKDSSPFGMINDTLRAGSDGVCALLPDPSPYHVSCWGGNAEGQLGNMTSSGTDIYGNPYNADPSEVEFPGGQLLVDVQSVSPGGGFSCGLLADHTIACWGRNDAGQLGDSGLTDDHTSSPVGVYTAQGDLLGSSVPVIEVEAGQRHACALTSNSDVFCWGDNTYGQLGTPFGGSTDVPFPIAIDSPIFTDNFDND